jgi:hypothetical protein
VMPYLSNIRADLVDPILWWVAMVITWLIMVGTALLLIKMTRRPEIPGISQSGRNDQLAGFLIGGLKGLLTVTFVTAGIQNYALEHVKNVSWAEDQVKASWALKWNDAYHPAHRIWTSKPVRHFVQHIQRMGMQGPDAPMDSQSGDVLEADDVVRTASRAEEGQDSQSSAGEPAGSSGTAPPPAEASETPVEKVERQVNHAARPADPNAN